MNTNASQDIVYHRPRLLTDNNMHYCPGCSHAAIHKIVADVLSDMNLGDNVIGIGSVGCSVFIYNYIDIDWIEAAHGRAPAVATAVSRLNPKKLVFTYQGDGDMASIGTTEIIHAANRGENITVIFINNSVYGMTGGQMAPTTPLGMKTITCPDGRNVEQNGYPLPITDLLTRLPGTCFVSREAVTSYKRVLHAKEALRTAFQNTLEKRGTSVVEFVATCCSGWKMSPVEANEWLNTRMKQMKMGRLK
ncbi:MAG: 2-oxoglutarate oxidoreductase [Bacteroidales bacterium]|nr:2-oxoglutarate oxidoreductase [Bacteroidales bacterium]